MTAILADGPDDARVAVLLAHGAGAPMDSPFMTAIACHLAGHGLRVLRFEFPYMAARRDSGIRKPPPRAETLSGFYRDAVAEVARPGRRLFIGGKSMGGRIAAMIARDPGAQDRVQGLVCLGFPFHPAGKPERLRIADLEAMTVPTLICQGERDPLGSRREVAAYRLSPAVRLHWLADGDHDLAPRKASGLTKDENWRDAAAVVAGFAAER